MKKRKFLISLLAGIMAGIMILSLLLGLLPKDASAASSSEIREQINQMEDQQKDFEKQIEKLKGQLKENATEIKDLVAKKSNIEQQVGLLHEQVEILNEQIAAFSLLIADKQEELDEAERKLKELNEKNKERIRAMEENGDLSYWTVLFQASSFADFLDRVNMIQEIALSDQRRLKEMRDVAKEIATAKELLVAERAELQAKKVELSLTQTELNARASEASQVLQQLLASGEEFEDLMEKAEEDILELENEIAKAENEYEEAVDREYWATYVPPTTAPPPTKKPSANSSGGTGGIGVNNSGLTWIVPCSYKRVSSVFQPDGRLHPVLGYVRPHNGVDLAQGCKSPIYATRSGVVTISTYSSSAGYYVTIDHLDGYKSTYMHMCKFPDVKVGEYVQAGQVIGCLGSTGWSTGDHLHFGISYNGEWVNPMDYIG